ncbi:hypothetical protein [Nostoc sp. TCL26-01]|uniref:hypothetical protein n=1 Tax=Nostoc sp. TCL26-01 TaxID=2576904 RepID=UPI0015B9D454|nr:hypothetical protein [Nostoc sp. TCL26-01]QLE56638.1 hypothetical protein FD725_14680 [Nostoc sp. TCL26-01]
MSEEKKQKPNTQDKTATASGGYQTPLDEEIRKTGTAAESDARQTAKPESAGEDNVAGSPNQGTESR